MNKLLSFLIVAWLVSLCYMVAQAEQQITGASIRVYWDRDHDGFLTPGDIGLGGQAVQLIVFPCDPADPNCVAGVEVQGGVTGANGQALFEVADGVWGVDGCYAPVGCIMNEGGIEFPVQGNGVWLPAVGN